MYRRYIYISMDTYIYIYYTLNLKKDPMNGKNIQKEDNYAQNITIQIISIQKR